MLVRINNSFLTKVIAIIVQFSLMTELFYFPKVKALTSGPSQPETSGFHPVQNNQLVDPFTGKFSYNIPVLTIGDYPINLSYNANVTMDQEASWAGLGWNLNVGQVTRTVRGLPDDFKGDIISKEFNMKDNITIGGLYGKDLEIAGLEKIKLKALQLQAGGSIEIKYNNYKGLSIGQTISAGIGAGKSAGPSNLGLMASLSLSTGGEGLNIQPNLSFGASLSDKDEVASSGLRAGWGISVNSRAGLQQRTLSTTISTTLFPPATLGNDKLFSSVSFTPQIQFPFNTIAIALALKAGAKLKPVETSGKVNGYFSKQSLKSKSASTPGYGFYYLEKGQTNQGALLDFNREKDAPFIPGCPNLPLTYLMPDIFQVGAQGIEGSYRAYRNHTGYVFDPMVQNSSFSSSQGFEANYGSTAKIGIDITDVSTNSSGKVWDENNQAFDAFDFKGLKENDPIHAIYFKKIGDISNGVDTRYHENSGGGRPVKFQLTGSGSDLEVGCANNYYRDAYTYGIDNGIRKFSKPAAASTAFQFLTVGQVKLSGDYHKDKYLSQVNLKDHQAGKIKVYSEEGKQYVFGLPAVNTLQKEVSFSCENNPDADHLVTFTGADNSAGNKKGLENFFSSTTLPPFAYAFYLTDVLSADYADISGNGPSMDDYGTYVQFHSSKKIPEYQWRTPYQLNRAQYDEQLTSLNNDDKAHYIYGKRDVWYIDSITTKSQIAIFHTSPRNDAYESADENGGIGNRSLYKIDSISLYNIHDYYSLKENASPELRAHFVYDYSRCKGIPNYKNNTSCTDPATCGGKLTLKELYFTYGASYKGKYQGYKFYYSNFNPGYSMLDYDRWGYYKKNDPLLPNYYFPYSIQDKLKRDSDVSAWLMNKIELPSGGTISVDYESDDYGFVQDKTAMRMFKVAGAANNTNPGTVYSVLYGNQYLFFDMEEYSNSYSEAYAALQQMIDFNVSQNLYFKFSVNVDKNLWNKDFVFGYCKMESTTDFGVANINNKYYGYIKLKEVPVDNSGNDLTNPISRAAMQFCRINTPVYAFDQVSFQDLETDPLNALKDLVNNASIINQLLEFAQGPNGSLKAKNIGNEFDSTKSWIRLNNPGKRKLGGGARVKKITRNNNWNLLESSEPFSTIEQEYFYELENGKSSGVATYEPMFGADEIPQHLPVVYSEEITPSLPNWARALAPNNSYIKEEPFGENAFPGAEIGYSRVIIKNKVPPGLNTPGTGYSLYEFFTAKEFPYVTTHTPVTSERRKWKNKFTIFNKKTSDYYTGTQGYYIELNNMHGKLKRSASYNAHGSIVNETVNEYFNLGEAVKVLQPDGTIILDTLGLEEDMVADFRQQESITEVASKHINIGLFLASAVPIIIPLFYPVSEQEILRFRSATTTRIVYKYGILKRQISSDLGAKITTDNLVFNSITGNPDLTSLNNQYNDTIYSYNLPAGSIYSGMNASGLNLNTPCLLETNFAGKVTTPNYFLTGGDDLLDLNSGKIYSIREVNSNKYLLNEQGQIIANGNFPSMLLIRSGHRNLVNTSAGSIVCLENPVKIKGNNLWELQFSQSAKIIDASATTYTEGYRERCNILPAAAKCTLTPEGKALELLINELLNKSNCLFFSNTDLYDYSKENYFVNTDTALLNIFAPAYLDNPVNSNYLRWEMTKISPSQYKATFLLATYAQPLCDVLFTFNCPPDNKTKTAICNSTVAIEHDEFCNAFVDFDISSNLACDSSIRLFIEPQCFPMFTSEISETSCGSGTSGIVNPYRNNLSGCWYPEKQFRFITDRSPSDLTSPINLRNDGFYENFSPFWKLQGSSWFSDTTGWTCVNTITMVDPDGNQIESRDPLNRYSSALLGYNHQLVTGNAGNARYNEIAFENFEDYFRGFSYELPQASHCYHFKFPDFSTNLSKDTAHTGYFSMRVPPAESIFIEQPLKQKINCPNANNQPAYNKSACTCTGIFSPEAGKEQKYVISYWQKSETYYSKGILPANNSVPPIVEEKMKLKSAIKINNISLPLKPMYSSEEIEGWVKEEFEFTIPANASGNIMIAFQNPNKPLGNTQIYFDDLRIHPYNASMKTYVYDPFSFRLVATLDENNFASVYQYDEEGNLQEIILETEKGRVFTQYHKKELRVR